MLLIEINYQARDSVKKGDFFFCAPELHCTCSTCMAHHFFQIITNSFYHKFSIFYENSELKIVQTCPFDL